MNQMLVGLPFSVSRTYILFFGALADPVVSEALSALEADLKQRRWRHVVVGMICNRAAEGIACMVKKTRRLENKSSREVRVALIGRVSAVRLAIDIISPSRKTDYPV